MQRSPEGALGRKRAGPWEGTELDLDDYRSSKRGRGQEIACDLRHMNLEGGSGAPCQQRDGGNPISDALPAVSGATSMHCSEGGGSPQAMQCTPRSEARTPSLQRQGGGGGAAAVGGQPSVQSSRHRLGGPRCTPMRLLDALPPTSPSDPPGLEGVNLRKATLMRSLQSRLMKGEGDSIGPSPPEAATVVMPAGAAGAAAAAAGEAQQARAVQWQVQQPPAAHTQQQQVAPHVLNAICDAHAGRPPAADGAGAGAAAAAAAAAAGGGRGSSTSPPEPFQLTSSLSRMMASPGCHRSSSPQPEGQPGQHCSGSEPVHTGCCADMAISPPGL